MRWSDAGSGVPISEPVSSLVEKFDGSVVDADAEWEGDGALARSLSAICFWLARLFASSSCFMSSSILAACSRI